MLKTGSNSRDRSGISNANRNTNCKTSSAIEPSSKASSKIPLLIPGSEKRSDSTSTSALPGKEAHFDDKLTPGALSLFALLFLSKSWFYMLVNKKVLVFETFILLGKCLKFVLCGCYLSKLVDMLC